MDIYDLIKNVTNYDGRLMYFLLSKAAHNKLITIVDLESILIRDFYGVVLMLIERNNPAIQISLAFKYSKQQETVEMANAIYHAEIKQKPQVPKKRSLW